MLPEEIFECLDPEVARYGTRIWDITYAAANIGYHSPR